MGTVEFINLAGKELLNSYDFTLEGWIIISMMDSKFLWILILILLIRSISLKERVKKLEENNK